ncbi:hypothetical protein [Candidatus Formimonas warabiya]|uniref:Uncharacterized protein n=1 Tax=Formimonas warabiya TaxID=1761012 RepID=A0A3G1KP64_FORW1|nr:hypothetical protein [Candidatus Formimonas warabiya]ATW24263.1 hypothetical protein DCMF_05200 [Candidatus Formimonas warabiya]
MKKYLKVFLFSLVLLLSLFSSAFAYPEEWDDYFSSVPEGSKPSSAQLESFYSQLNGDYVYFIWDQHTWWQLIGNDVSCTLYRSGSSYYLHTADEQSYLRMSRSGSIATESHGALLCTTSYLMTIDELDPQGTPGEGENPGEDPNPPITNPYGLELSDLLPTLLATCSVILPKALLILALMLSVALFSRRFRGWVMRLLH